MKFISKKDMILPKRKPKSHKGQNGRLLVIGGSRDYVGAVALAGLAAMRTGADYVTVAVPEKVGWALNRLTPDLVVKKFKVDGFCAACVKDILKLEKNADAVLIGNGIGDHAKTFVQRYVKASKKPMIIDGDALKFVDIRQLKKNPCILTPHHAEFQHLLKNAKVKSEKELKKALGDNIILLKGQIDEIITKTKTYYNKTGNPGMTKAGTGDVLAGIAAGFYCQSLSAKQSAINAAFINGMIGDKLLKERKGAYSFIASDIVKDLRNFRK